MTRSAGRAIVVGAGIVGAACARTLAEDGWAVTVVDHQPIGSGATAAGMGHVVALDDSDAQFALCRYSRDLWDALEPDLPAAVEFTRAGTLWVATDEAEWLEAHRKARFFAERGVEADLVDAAQLHQIEPHLHPNLVGGLRIPGDSVIYPPSASAFLIERAQAAGARFDLGPPVRAVTGSEVERADGSTQGTDLVVLAAGAAASRLLPELPIRPRKGHLVITDRHPGFVHHQILELGYLKSAHGTDGDSVAFNVQPRATGQILIGSSRQFDAPDPAVEPRMVRRMIDQALRFLPGLARLAAIRAWTGYRAATPDSLPIIGWHPEVPGLMIAAGHEGLGITTSLGTAALVADLAAGRPSAIPSDPYRPERFAAGVPQATTH